MATPGITEQELLAAVIEGALTLLTQELDVYEEQISPTGEVVHKKVGTRKTITAANLQAANATLNSKAVQKHFAQSGRKTVNVQKRLRKERNNKLEVLDE